MTDAMKKVLSVSRRTDIPAFYMPWFMEGVARGRLPVQNPFNRQVRQVAISPLSVHTLVFWSKNFGPFLDARFGEQLRQKGYHLLFNFTVNSRSTELEPRVPPLSERLMQMQELARRFGGQAVQWRFDPICHFRIGDNQRQDNLADFERIAETAAHSGITSCTTSFMDHYRKITRRLTGGLHFQDPSIDEKCGILLNMASTLRPMGIALRACCERDVLSELPEGASIRPAACVSGQRIMDLYGGRVSLRQDAGQRKASGCGCTESVDVGSYAYHPCYHNCLFCYANPARDQRA